MHDVERVKALGIFAAVNFCLSAPLHVSTFVGTWSTTMSPKPRAALLCLFHLLAFTSFILFIFQSSNMWGYARARISEDVRGMRRWATTLRERTREVWARREAGWWAMKNGPRLPLVLVYCMAPYSVLAAAHWGPTDPLRGWSAMWMFIHLLVAYLMLCIEPRARVRYDEILRDWRGEGD